MFFSQKKLWLMHGEKNGELFFSIPVQKIITVNYSPKEKKDFNQISIYYYGSDNQKIKDIKLKPQSNHEIKEWIFEINNIASFNKYDPNPKEPPTTYDRYFKNIYLNIQEIAKRLSVLEFILNVRHMIYFMNAMKAKRNFCERFYSSLYCSVFSAGSSKNDNPKGSLKLIESIAAPQQQTVENGTCNNSEEK